MRRLSLDGRVRSPAAKPSPTLDIPRLRYQVFHGAVRARLGKPRKEAGVAQGKAGRESSGGERSERIHR